MRANYPHPPKYTRHNSSRDLSACDHSHLPLSYLRPFDSTLVPLCPFSTSPDRHFGVGGTSSGTLARPRRVEECWGSLTDEGNSARRGVSAVLTLRADLRRVSFIVHSRFLAMKKRAPVTTRPLSVQVCPGDEFNKTVEGADSLPRMATTTTITTMATSPPVDIETALPELPEAPPSVPD